MINLVSIQCWAKDCHGVVSRVVDGDTIIVDADCQDDMKVRLGEIDAPEKSQPYGKQSRQMLVDLVEGQEVSIHEQAIDKYRRMVAVVIRADDGLNVNRQMVAEGGAWVYRHYLRDETLLKVEQHARNDALGLWEHSYNPVPPWQWRQSHRKN